jgi:hypothetical protein
LERKGCSKYELKFADPKDESIYRTAQDKWQKSEDAMNGQLKVNMKKLVDLVDFLWT